MPPGGMSGIVRITGQSDADQSSIQRPFSQDPVGTTSPDGSIKRAIRILKPTTSAGATIDLQ